jgi:hypothetical protein
VNKQADDLEGIIHAESSEEAWRRARVAVAICNGWAVAHAARIGIKLKAKTAVAFLRIDDKLRVTDAEGAPELTLHDGTPIPRLGANESYKHMGILRSMHGDTGAAAAAFHDRVRAVYGRLGRLRLPARALFRAADVTLGGVCAYYGASSVVSRKECDDAEAQWRRLLNKRSAREWSAPRVDIYGPLGRKHLYGVVGGGALHSAFRIICDADDLGRQRMAQAELARDFYRLGCRTAPHLWHPDHP